MATATTAAEDLRSNSARALDETIEWLARRVPDRFPPGFHPLHGTKSMASEVAGELARRTAARLKDDERYRRTRLHDDLEKLRRCLLDHELDARRLQDLRDTIDRKLDELAQPPPVPATPEHWRELAADLGAVLPPNVDDAAAVALAQAVGVLQQVGDRRCDMPKAEFVACALGHGAPSVEARILRRVVAGHGLPPVRASDRAWALDRASARYTAGPVVPSAWASNSLPLWLEALLRDFGLVVPAGPDDVSIREEYERRLQALQARERQAERDAAKASEPPGSGGAESGGFLRRAAAAVAALKPTEDFAASRRQLEGWATGERTRGWNERNERTADLVAAIVASLDKLLASREIDLAWWWAREMRRHLANDPGAREMAATGPITGGGDHLAAWRIFRTFNINLAVKA